MTTGVVDLGSGRVVAAHETPAFLNLVYDPVTGFWQTVNASSGKQHVINYLWNTATLAFEVATTPSAGVGSNVSVTNFPATQPVTGNFWQATQPVSISGSVPVTGPVTDAQLRASAVPVSLAQSVDTTSNAVVSAANSTVTPLGIGGVFTGTAIDLLNYSTLRLNFISDVASAAGGLQIQFSSNGTNWDIVKSTTFTPANGGIYAIFNRIARYARVVYTNGGTAQAYVRLQTLVVPNSSEMHRAFLADVPTDSSGALVVQSVLVGKTTAGGGAYVPVKVNPSGALTAEVTQAGAWSVGINNFPATQPVSIAAAVALDAGTLAALETITVSNMVAQGVTDAQLRATPLPVSQPAATDWRADQRRGLVPQFAVINASAAGDNVLVAAQGGALKIKVLQYTIIAAGVVNATLRQGTTPITGAIPLVANSGVASPYVAPSFGHLMETAANAALNLNLSAAIAVTGHLTYIVEA